MGTTYAELQTPEYWQNRLAQIEDELNDMIGAVGGVISNMSFDQAEAYKRLTEERAYAKTQITSLASSSGWTVATFTQANHSQYEV